MPPKSKRVLPGKRYPLNMRTTKELRDKIEEAAMASGRSLVQEVEFRLEQSFRREENDKQSKETLETVGSKLIKEMRKEMQKEFSSPKFLAWIEGMNALMKEPVMETDKKKDSKAPVKEPVMETDKKDSK